MEEIEKTMEKVKALIQEGNPGEAVFAALSASIKEHPETAELLIEGLADISHPATAQSLQRLMEATGEKKIRRRIKRVLYRLKSKGIPIEEMIINRGLPILMPLQAEPPQGFGSGIDPVGHRLLVLVVPHAGRGIVVLDGVVSDTEGFVTFSGAEMTRKEVRSYLDPLRQGSAFPLVEMEASHVGFLFDQAYHLELILKKTPPRDYLHFKGEVGKVKKDDRRPPIYDRISPEEIEGDDRWLKKGEALLKEEPFITWIIDESLIRPYSDSIQEAKESKLFIHQGQREGRFHEIYLKAFSEIFSEGLIVLYRRRFEETAYVLYQSGKEEEAKAALALAADLKKPLNPLQPNPFLYQMVVRSISLPLAEAEEKRKEQPSLIVKP